MVTGMLESFSHEDWQKFLAFVTGTPNIPLEGNITIELRDNLSVESLPLSHTCFNSIELPRYPTLEVMREKVLSAISLVGANEFGFA